MMDPSGVSRFRNLTYHESGRTVSLLRQDPQKQLNLSPRQQLSCPRPLDILLVDEHHDTLRAMAPLLRGPIITVTMTNRQRIEIAVDDALRGHSIMDPSPPSGIVTRMKTRSPILLLAAAAVGLLFEYRLRTEPVVMAEAAQTPDPQLQRLEVEIQSLKDRVARAGQPAADGDAKAIAADAVINVRHFGAKGDGVTDDTAALQAALDAAGNNAPWGVRGTIIFIPPGEYLISSTLQVYRMSFEMIGCGFGNSPAYAASPGKGSVMRWNGPPDTPMVKIRDSHGISIRRIRWEGKAGVSGTTAINLNWVPADQQGTNGRTVIEQCQFGRYAHTTQGIHKGDLAYGVLMDGENGNNDEFQIHRCLFSNCTSAGIKIVNTQSVWGSINDCTISEGGAGVETAASVTANNLCFDACNPDWKINSTAHVSVYGWQSERSKRLARLSPEASLTADSGYLQLGSVTDGVMIDAFPSESAQIILREMFFTENSKMPRPRIRFGPSEKDRVVGSNFRVKVIDSTGLYPDQFELGGALWAQVPESRGEVEFAGRADQFYAFRNFLRMNLPSARTLDPTRFDLTVADSAPSRINASGPVAVESTSAKVYAAAGSPENALGASVGSIYLRTDGDRTATLYVKESGSDKTGWIAK